MCGLAGIVDPAGATPEAELAAIAQSMGDALVHRGPDDAGLWCDPRLGVALSHRRLSILDLSNAGRQPMISHDGRLVLVCNGEIYNFAEVRERLEAAGTRIGWRGHCDTEIMLEAIAQWGAHEAARCFVGMFAFALLDRRERTVTLGRDRFGEKPLYYGWVDRRFAFASEIKALRAMPGWQNPLDRAALGLYFRHGFVPAPFSIHGGIYKLTPGATLTLPLAALSSTPGRHDAGSIANIRPLPYWSLEEAVEHSRIHPWPGSAEDAVDELERLLGRAAKLQTVADVPVGAFLSGGIDSSTVVAAMQTCGVRPVRTFSIGFSEAGYDEAGFARRVARHLETEHTELYVGPEDALDCIPALAAIQDEPFADASQIPTYLAARLARQSVKVSLSGDGGDELFGGYYRHFLSRPLALAGKATPAWLSSLAGRALASLPSLPQSRARKLGRALRASGASNLYLALASHDDAGKVLRDATSTALPALARHDAAGLQRPAESMMFLDTLSYLPDDILVKMDRAAMAVGLESRMPFLDHRIAEFAWSLPLAMRVGGGGKRIVRQLLGRHVPNALFDRHKAGFAVPIGAWLRGPLRQWAEPLLDRRSLDEPELLDAAVVRERWAQHQSGTRNWEDFLWDVLMFQAWREQQRAAA